MRPKSICPIMLTNSICSTYSRTVLTEIDEYALVVAIIALAAVAAMSSMASKISNVFSALGSKLSSSIS